jgi:hypothetical protein
MKNSAWLIGRTAANSGHILLNDETISGNHATLNYQDGKYYLIDNNSRNGTFLVYKNETILLNQHYEVRPEDEIYFGKKRCFLKEIILLSQLKKGVESSELIILDGNYEPNSEPEISIEKVIESEVPIQKSKRIRCLECTSPIFSHEACPKCGSTTHLK